MTEMQALDLQVAASSGGTVPTPKRLTSRTGQPLGLPMKLGFPKLGVRTLLKVPIIGTIVLGGYIGVPLFGETTK